MSEPVAPSTRAIIYGTAWKEERTEELTALALAAGFRAIDTANQRKHYVEAAVGAAVAKSGLPRDELFLQTKFTYARGQDHRLPYDRRAPLATQVRQSFDRSCEHLGVEHLDAYLLHGPWSDRGWSDEDREVWAVMEELHDAARVRHLGVSNVGLDQLGELCGRARVTPSFVQNRCHADTGWDGELRRFCRERSIGYQAFSLLTANRGALASPALKKIARRVEATIPQLVFRFAIAAGMMPLTGTADREHMAQDLEAVRLALEPADLEVIEGIATAGRAG